MALDRYNVSMRQRGGTIHCGSCGMSYMHSFDALSEIRRAASGRIDGRRTCKLKTK